MGWTTPLTAVAGIVATAAQFNASHRDNLNFLATPPSVRVHDTNGGPLNSGVIYPLNMNAERYKTDAGMHSNITNTGRLVCTVAGKYHIFGSAQFSAHDVGYRWVFIQRNGTQTIGSTTTPALVGGFATGLSVSTIFALSVGDYVTLNMNHNAGTALTLSVTSAYTPEFGMTWTGF